MGASTETWPEVEYARPAGRPSKYPWTEWFDGGVWKLEQPEDFTTDPNSFRVTIRGAAKRLGYEVEIRRPADNDDVLYVQATEAGETGAGTETGAGAATPAKSKRRK